MSPRALSLVLGSMLVVASTAGAEPAVKSFAGPNGPMNAVAVSGDGKYVAGVCGGDLTVWDVAGAKQVLAVRGQSSGWSVAFSPDGKTLAAPLAGNNIGLWDTTTWKPLRQLEGHTAVVWSVAYSGDGQKLVSACTDGTARIWDVKKGKEELRLTGPSGPWSPAFSPDGRHVAIGFDNGTIIVFDARNGKEVRQWQGAADGGIWPLAFSADGRMIVSERYAGGTVRVWEVATGEPRDGFDGAGSGWAVTFAGRGKLAFGAGPGGVKVWDGRTGKTHEVKPEKANLLSVASSADGRIVAAGDNTGGVHVWDITELLKGLQPKEAKLDAKELDEHWAALSEVEGERAFQSVRALTSAPGQALPALRERLKPAKAEDKDAAAIAKLVAQLDDDDFETREKASTELAKLGPKAAAQLRAALEKAKSAEVRKRLNDLLDRWEKTPMTPEELRAMRALEVLEDVGTPAAREVLRALARGAADALLTREAKATLERMDRR